MTREACGGPAVVAAILAAGGSRRLGRPKQLVALAGETLLARAVRTARSSKAARVAVVVGAHAEQVEGVLAGEDVVILRNDEWSEGMSSSVRAAARFAASCPDAHGLALLACDQPLLTTGHLDALIEAFAARPRTIASAYASTVGIPAVFERSDWAALSRLTGDRGAKALLAGADSISWADGAFDCDTDDDVARAEARARG